MFDHAAHAEIATDGSRPTWCSVWCLIFVPLWSQSTPYCNSTCWLDVACTPWW